MSEEYNEYLKFLEKQTKPFFINKDDSPQTKISIIGPNKKCIELKQLIGLNYFSTDEKDIIYIEDISDNKIFTNDLIKKNLKLHLSDNVLYLDFDTNYYYILIEFDNFEQFQYCINNKRITVALLNDNKSDIINKWTTNVNLL